MAGSTLRHRCSDRMPAVEDALHPLDESQIADHQCGIVIWLPSYKRLFSRICVGSIGRKERNAEAAPALNMFPKFGDVAISTYFLRVQSLDRLLGSVLVEEPEPDRERNDDADDHGLARVTRCSGDRRRHEGEQEQRVAKLSYEHREPTRTMATQRVRAVGAQPGERFLTRQATSSRLQCVGDLVRRCPRRDLEVFQHRLGTLPVAMSAYGHRVKQQLALRSGPFPPSSLGSREVLET